jgi:hypothetical protein
METVHLSKLEPELAAQLLVGFAKRDPTGMLDERQLPQRLARAACLLATSEDNKSQAVYVIRIENGVAWVDFAKGFGAMDWCGVLGPVIEAQCKGVRRVAFQTARPGLVRRAKAQGYTVRGWIMGKDVQ